MRPRCIVIGRVVDQERLERPEEQARRSADALELLVAALLVIGIAQLAPQFLEHEVATGNLRRRAAARAPAN